MIYCKSNPTLCIKLDKALILYIAKRFMLQSCCNFATRAAYHAAVLLSNSDLINNFNQHNKKPLVKKIVDYTLDDNKGIIQHKTALLKHISNQQFPAEYIYGPFLETTLSNIITYNEKAPVDFRILNELGCLKEYMQNFNHNIVNIHATLDTPTIIFPKANQPNVDFIVKIVNNITGLKTTYQDEKSGMDMLKHTTKGSMGVLTYDESFDNIQMTSNPINIVKLIEYNQRRVLMIKEALKHEGLLTDPVFLDAINDAQDIAKAMKGKSYNDFAKIHNQLQEHLWNEIQSHPKFPQSLSFIFLKQVVNQPATDNEFIFSKSFQTRLQPNKIYDLNNRGDFNECLAAFMYAGKEIDPLFIKKFYHLHYNGMTLNHSILSLLKTLAKDGLQ